MFPSIPRILSSTFQSSGVHAALTAAIQKIETVVKPVFSVSLPETVADMISNVEPIIRSSTTGAAKISVASGIGAYAVLGICGFLSIASLAKKIKTNISEIRRLRQIPTQRVALTDHVRRLTFNVLKLSSSISSVAYSSFALAQGAVKIAGLSEPLIAALGSVVTVACTAAGSLAVLVGVTLTSYHGLECYKAFQRKREIRARLDAPPKKPVHISQDMFDTCAAIRTLKLKKELMVANKDFSLHLMKASAGSLSVVSGALLIGGAFSGGAAASGIAIAAIALGVISLSVSVWLYFRKRQLVGQIEQAPRADKAGLQAIKDGVGSYTDEQKREIAALLDIDISGQAGGLNNLTEQSIESACSQFVS